VALDGNNHLFVTGYANSRISRINTLTGGVDWTKTAPYGARGVIVTEDGDVWTANLESDTVTRFSNDGILKATIQTGGGPNALSVDNEGNIWAVDHNDVYIHRIKPAINGVDFSKMIVSGTHVGYSTMTAPTSKVYDKGTWTVIHDSLTDNAYWGTISWNSYEPKGTKVTVRVRSSNDKTNWSNWEPANNGLNLKLTPNGRYLEVEVILEKFNSAQSPVVYDVTVNTLDSAALTTDLGVSITGNKSSLNVGGTVKLTVKAFNNGPNGASVEVNYKIPIGLKLLSSQGAGTYDPDTGVWSVGILPAGGNASMELTLQANNAGYFVNLVSVYGDLALFSTKSLNGAVRAFSVKAASVGDLNPGNNQASYDITSIDPGQTADTNTFTYDFPPVTPPTQPQPPNNPPTPPGPTPPEPQPPGPAPPNNPLHPTGQLGRDIAGVRNAISQGTLKDVMNKSVLPEWNLTQDNEPEEPAEDPPWLIYAIIIIGALIGAALVITPAGEYLQRIINGILAALSSAWLYLSYLGYSLKKFLENAILRILVQYGSYISAVLQELYSTPLTGVGPTTVIGLGLRFLAEKFPVLKPFIAPFIHTLDQLTYYEISKKLNELFNKK
jgi:hypothetical protein